MTPSLFNPAKENLSGAQLEQLQFNKLKLLIERVYDSSPYYKAKFDTAGVSLSLQSLDVYYNYPFFDKDEERLSQARSKVELSHPFGMHITCDPKSVNRISSSSGTTGAPTFSGFTKTDRALAAENCGRGMVRMGIEPGDVVLHASVISMWIAGMPAIDSIDGLWRLCRASWRTERGRTRCTDRPGSAPENDTHNIVAAVHHQLRFRVTPTLISESEFEIRSGTTGKMKLVELIEENNDRALSR